MHLITFLAQAATAEDCSIKPQRQHIRLLEDQGSVRSPSAPSHRACDRSAAMCLRHQATIILFNSSLSTFLDNIIRLFFRQISHPPPQLAPLIIKESLSKAGRQRKVEALLSALPHGVGTASARTRNSRL